ncbi:PglZ domain-containing protein [Geodermatophilus tzadiensis]|uniref:PglZ domain-containing protein n=1 Tax=Geodermatophilus tzadiensis TaxID=1137988 RepID=A0A2T0SUU9_9ACTN|nr:BREX-2 system phosphatase PglZ [Geodermatophilus tzadiensis]PRY37178.1 PglZ domain-containing protein [Geodermatophilus tzadiensis]
MTAGAPSVATVPVVRALLDEARRKNYTAGALGIRARPEWPGAGTFEHQGVPVTVVPCVSTLAVREALRQRGPDRWLVILTDRDDGDLGAGVRSHLIWHRLRTPDPWDAVQGRFAATALDPALPTVPGHRELALGLLACTPADGGWPPAPGGVLTRDHALGSVARRHLGLPAEELTADAVLRWTAAPHTSGLIADLRTLAGDALTDAVLDWIAGHLGAAAAPVRQLLRRGQGGDAVPLGVVLDTLLQARAGQRADDVVLAREALVRLEPRTGGAGVPPTALDAWATQAGGLVRRQLESRAEAAAAERLLAEADLLLAEARATALAECSALLPAALPARLARLAAALRSAVASSPAETVDRPAVSASRLDDVEAAWHAVQDHALAPGDPRVTAFRAAVRLARWLALDSTAAESTLPALHRRHLDVDAWVDSAVNDAAAGVGEPELGAALAAVLAAVQQRRNRHDEQFAAALADHTRSDRPGSPAMLLLEELLPEVVLPLARRTPVLLLVLDGMSAAVGTEVLADIVARSPGNWTEALPEGQPRRIGAVSVLPSITEVSRASLLSGELTVGGQDVEQRGYAALARAHRLPGAQLFHKKPLDSTAMGFAVAGDVGAAIDDQSGRPLVTCVLNTIDDALDRSDPAGTEWTAEAIKHLRPLLERARLAGRVVVLTSDHGHVVERRQGTQRSAPALSSARSRPDGPVGDGELLVTGRRVLKHDGRAVLAVDERLRYGPLKAGYHGGAAPAEIVVPVHVLVAGSQTAGTSLVPARPQEPEWWVGPVAGPPAAPAVPSAPAPRPRKTAAPSSLLTLFDDLEPEPAPAPAADSLGAVTVASATYADQRRLAGRVTVTDQQVRQLLDALAAAPDRRLPASAAARALDVAPAALRGAVLHAQRLLNVEGYAVLGVDVDGSTVRLDEPLLREQFELRA